ncbi:MAG TPA: toll/interleukin-1 receptor domain-containing protein [Thermoanaerobaculia bacterium]|nr:toll/interleukin-1 receptor domain-containing protein [Thermoanaerobaculia bacterium]
MEPARVEQFEGSAQRWREVYRLLSPSERVTLIQEIATRLSHNDWPVIDLTLRQFGLPTFDDWQGGQQAYVIEMIQRAQDEVLVDLAAHLGYDSRGRGSALEPSFWQRGNLRVFITHLATEKSVASAIQEKLSWYHISSFVAHKDIEPTRQWLDEIELGLNTADALVALLHPGFKQSNWTDQETGFALGRGLLVITVRYGQDPYGFLAKAQAIQGEGKDIEVLADEMFRLIRKHKQTRRTMAEALMQGFEGSSSVLVYRAASLDSSGFRGQGDAVRSGSPPEPRPARVQGGAESSS